MPKFMREDRYIVIKKSHLNGKQMNAIYRCIDDNHIAQVDCVVVEADWPEYEQTWTAIEKRCAENPDDGKVHE